MSEKKKTCALCGKPTGKESDLLAVCDSCFQDAPDSREEENGDEAAARRAESRWRRFVPQEYGETQREKLPSDLARKRFDQMKRFDWRKKKGIYLFGDSGAGKTRLAYEALKTAFFKGASVNSIFAGEIRARLLADWGAAEKILQETRRPDVLLFDDLGQGAKMGQLDEIQLTILENRSKAQKVTLITSNFSQVELPKRFQNVRTGEAIARRAGKDYSIILGLSEDKAKRD